MLGASGRGVEFHKLFLSGNCFSSERSQGLKCISGCTVWVASSAIRHTSIDIARHFFFVSEVVVKQVDRAVILLPQSMTDHQRESLASHDSRLNNLKLCLNTLNKRTWTNCLWIWRMMSCSYLRSGCIEGQR